jgi:hypothetical protein
LAPFSCPFCLCANPSPLTHSGLLSANDVP